MVQSRRSLNRRAKDGAEQIDINKTAVHRGIAGNTQLKCLTDDKHSMFVCWTLRKVEIKSKGVSLHWDQGLRTYGDFWWQVILNSQQTGLAGVCMCVCGGGWDGRRKWRTNGSNERNTRAIQQRPGSAQRLLMSQHIKGSWLYNTNFFTSWGRTHYRCARLH